MTTKTPFKSAKFDSFSEIRAWTSHQTGIFPSSSAAGGGGGTKRTCQCLSTLLSNENTYSKNLVVVAEVVVEVVVVAVTIPVSAAAIMAEEKDMGQPDRVGNDDDDDEYGVNFLSKEAEKSRTAALMVRKQFDLKVSTRTPPGAVWVSDSNEGKLPEKAQDDEK